MRDNDTPVTHGDRGTSKLKKELREMEPDPDWKGEALKDAEEKAKEARRPGAGLDEKRKGTAVPDH